MSYPVRGRPAVAMIELIFAIVVIALVLSSVPMLLQQTRQSMYVGIQQESIAMAASEIGLIMTHQWDEGDTNISIGSPILQTNGAAALNEVGMTGYRAGTPSGSPRTFRRNDGGRASAHPIGPDTGESNITDYDDMDDYNGASITLTNLGSTTTQAGDTIDVNVQMDVSVAYAEDNSSYNITSPTYNFPPPSSLPTTNVKTLKIELTSSSTATELQKKIVFNAFSCNIGSYKLTTRAIP